MFVKKGNQISVAVLDSVWTGEWDLKDDSIHNPIACTINSRKEAYRAINSFCNANTDYSFLVFDTPGGVRAFCISHQFEPTSWESFRLHSKLNCDPFFQELTYKGKEYTARVTPKPKRLEQTGKDYISKKKYLIGKGKPLPALVKEVSLYYEQVIKNRV
jgi:hypothetical protein